MLGSTKINVSYNNEGVLQWWSLNFPYTTTREIMNSALNPSYSNVGEK